MTILDLFLVVDDWRKLLFYHKDTKTFDGLPI